MADKPKLSLAIDTVTLQTDEMTEADGILSVPAVIARQMVYDYGGTKILKPFDELESAAGFADGIPVTREHPAEGVVTSRDAVLGYLRNPIAEADELKGTLEIADTKLITDIKDGTIKEVSGGFFCNIDATAGTLDGVDYVAIQRDIYMNHVAIVNEGRCSIADGCGLNLTDSRTVDAPPDLIGKLDTAIGMATSEWGSGALKDLLIEIKEMVMTKETDSIESLTAERDALTKTVETLTKERDTIRDEAEKIVKDEKDAIIKELLEAQKTKKEEDLQELRYDALKTELEMVRELRADKLTFRGDGSDTSIDDAYRGVTS